MRVRAQYLVASRVQDSTLSGSLYLILVDIPSEPAMTGTGVGVAAVQDIQTGDPKTRIVTPPGASTYIFLSNENDTVREVRFTCRRLELGDLLRVAMGCRRFGNLIRPLNRPDVQRSLKNSATNV